MVNKNVSSCLLKDGKEVNAVMLVGRLFHARVKGHRTSRLDCERRSGDELVLKLLRLDLDDVTDIDAGDLGGLCIVNSPVTRRNNTYLLTQN